MPRNATTGYPGWAWAGKIAGTQLNLSGCGLVSTGGVVRPIFDAARPPPTCQFAVDHQGKPQIVQTRQGPALLVVAPQPLPNSKWCDTSVRAVVLREGRIFISEDTQRLRSCAPGPYDSKMFEVLVTRIRPL